MENNKLSEEELLEGPPPKVKRISLFKMFAINIFIIISMGYAFNGVYL
jgi:hypothetical protein